MRWLLAAGLLALLAAPLAQPAGAALLPDLETVVPLHLGLQNAHQREVLRFSNGIANTGDGHWRMRPEFPAESGPAVQRAVQQLLDAQGSVAQEQVVSTFEFHEEHNHWHIGDVARFEVRPALDDGTGGAWGDVLANDRGEVVSLKTTFCLIDWYKLEGPSRTRDRAYFDCNGDVQGIQPGWVDQYHQSTGGQQLDLTGAPAGVYYLVSTANHAGVFVEADTGNNASWTSFALARDSQGNPRLRVLAHAPCSGGLCGEQAPNR